ncbi:MAG: ion transporter [Sulfurimonas sp.]|jgi:voltage-gated potassium channel
MNFFGRIIVDFAYLIHTFDAYQHKKRLVYDILENNKNRYKQYFDILMMSLIFVSVVILIIEVKNEVPNEVRYFNSYVISIIFFIEYILRFWTSSSVSEIIISKSEHDAMLGREFSLSRAIAKVIKAKLSFMFSFKAIIDLLAVLPFFHELRLLRLFVLFRVFKLFRYATSFQIFASILQTKKFEFFILFMFASIVISVSSILMYVMEANNPASKVNTLFDAFYWSVVTVATVGYGDIVPITHEGRAVAMVVIFSGVALIAFTTSIIVSALTEKLSEIRDMKTIEDVRKLKKFYIICGYENVAQEVSKKLKNGITNIIVLDEDEHRIANAKKDGLIALNYDPGDAQSYKIIGIDLNTQVKAVLCLRENDVENVYTTLTVRSINKDVNIVSLLMDDSNRKKLNFAGVNEILYPKGLVGMISKELIGRPVAFEVIHALRNDYYGVNVEEILVDDRMSQKLLYVHELNNHKFRIVLLGIFKKDKKRFFFNPIDATMLESGDYLLVIGKSVFIKEFEKHLHKKIKHEK